MLAETLTYKDYNGEERTETFYFNLNKSEVAMMELKHPGGYSEFLKRIVESKDQKKIVESFQQLIEDSYGVKSDDGHYFKKSKEAFELFKSTEAYSELLIKILSDPEAASRFVNGIMPITDLNEQQKAEIAVKTQQLIESKQ